MSLDFLKSNSSESSRLVSARYEDVRIQNDINIFVEAKVMMEYTDNRYYLIIQNYYKLLKI